MWPGSALLLRAELFPSEGEPRELSDLLVWMVGERGDGTFFPAESFGAPKPGQQNPSSGHLCPVKLHVLNVLPTLPQGPWNRALFDFLLKKMPMFFFFFLFPSL